MAERRAVNKYYPPDWGPSKGSANTYQKSHHLRHRARKIDQGILTVRFEMPFGIICSGCENFIGMGVRYNAEKSRNGNYYTTPIYKFRMKCHLCDNHFEIETDPSKFDYKIISGAVRQVRYDRTKELDDTQESNKAEQGHQHQDGSSSPNDAMSRLERKIEGKQREELMIPSLHEVKEWRSKHDNSFYNNQLLRSQYRDRRKSRRLERKRAEQRVELDILKRKHNESASLDVKKKKYMDTPIFDVPKQDKKPKCDKITIKNKSVPSTSKTVPPIDMNLPIKIKADPG